MTITIDEATEVLSQDITYTYPARFEELREAIQLGIEALKQVKYLQQMDADYKDLILPGQTEGKVKLKAVAMVVDKVDSNGNLVTRKAMEEALKRFTGCPLGYEFNPNIPPIGKVIKAELVGDKVEIEAEVDKPFNEKLAIVPSFTIKAFHMEGDIRVIEDVDLLHMSLTSQPADSDVTMQEI